MGHSAGGQLALCLAAHQRPIKGVIALAGVVDLRRGYELHLSHDAVVEFLGGSPNQVPRRYQEADPMQLSVKVPQFLFHGSADDEVPPDFSRAYAAAKKKRSGVKRENVELVEIAGAGHYELIDPRTPAWMRVEETVLQLLQPT
jgi:dipeptidyl aminopeptidase/acylaminoacyl peptidase